MMDEQDFRNLSNLAASCKVNIGVLLSKYIYLMYLTSVSCTVTAVPRILRWQHIRLVINL